MPKFSKDFKSSESPSEYITFSRGKIATENEKGEFIGYRDSLIIRTEYTDIEENSISAIPKEDIPELIAFLKEIL